MVNLLGQKLILKYSKINKKIKIFTTRPDTIYGATFLALSTEQDIAKNYLKNMVLKKFIDECKNMNPDKVKKGYNTGLLLNILLLKIKQYPFLSQILFLMEYGLGAIFGCPAHDQRDLDFAKQYNLEIIPVVKPVHIKIMIYY